MRNFPYRVIHAACQIFCLLWFAWSDLAFGSQAGTRAPKVGLALSGGGARGAAHIGVLKVLEREGIPIDFIAGTSYGALVGGFYALGYSPEEIEKIFSSQDWDELFSNAPDRRLSPVFRRRNFRYLGDLSLRNFKVELPTALSGGQKLIETFNYYTTKGILAANYDFDRLRIPFRAVATDLLTGEPFIFKQGSMTQALRASIALPLIFTPVEHGDMLLVDGGLVNDLPADVVRSMGADTVIAVDVTTPLLKKKAMRTFIDVLDQALSLQMKRSVQENLKYANLIVTPELDGFRFSDYARVMEISARGEAAAQSLKEELHKLVGSVREATSPGSLTSAATPVIDSVTFDNLTHVQASQLLKELANKPDRQLDLTLLRRDLGRLYATGLFESVDYRLEQMKENRYRLHYVVKESAPQSFGGSMRYDRDYKFVALGEFNARGIFSTPSFATLSTQFGGLENHSASLRLIHPGVPFLFIEPQTHLRKLERLDTRDRAAVDKFTDKRRGAQLLIGGTLFSRIEASLGYRFERVAIVGGTSPQRETVPRRLAGLRLRVHRDTLDRHDFPASGMQASFQFDKTSQGLGSDFSYSRWQGDLQRFFSFSNKSTLQLHGGAVLSRGAIPFYERFFIGGLNFSEIGSQHLLGYKRDELVALHATLWGAAYRHQIFARPLSLVRRGYVYLHYNVAAVSNRELRPYDFTFYNGGGTGLLLDTILGPVRLVGGWGEGGRFNFHLSVGPAF